MTKNVKLGNDVVSGVQKWQFESADTEGTWVDYVETSDADAAASDIKNGKTAYVNGVKITGNHTDKTEQTKTAALSMVSGDQVVTPDSNKVLTQVTITKPATLVPGNIKKDVVIGGVTGSYEGIIPTGNQDISTLSEYDVSAKATARVSATERAKIIAENIKKDITILGVTGTLDAGGSADLDELLEETF